MDNNYPSWPNWPSNRTAIIAEVGINHGGDESLAWEMIISAHENGADFVKLQSYVTKNFFHPSLSYYKAAKSMELSFSAQERLFTKAKNKRIPLITTLYDFDSVDFISKFSTACYKIASMDNDNYPLINYVAKKGNPILVSTGMADLAEIRKITEVVKSCENDKLVLLHCISDYPTKPENTHLVMLSLLKESFDCFVGLSDHSLGITVAQIGISLGAAVIEKHFTIDRNLSKKMPEADHSLSIEPGELKQLRVFCETTPLAIGKSTDKFIRNNESEKNMIRRGIYAKRRIVAGERLSMENAIFLRPVNGIGVNNWEEVEGKITNCDIVKYSPIQYKDLNLK